MADEKMVIVIEFDIPTEDNPEKPGEILQNVKSVFEDETGIKIYMAIKETANNIRDILNAEGL